ncbi:MAG: hypothetical protein AAF438_00375 [Pseudomonadota bacterium]
MLAGHFATALVADQKLHRKGTLFYYLVASQLPDLLWHVFHYIGLEVTRPENMLDVSLQGLSVDMMFSHDLLPSVVWTGLVFAVGFGVFKNIKIGLMGAVVFIVHIAADYLGGYPHHVFGPDTHPVGIPLYPTAPYVSVALEAVFSGVLIWYFFRQENRLGFSRPAYSRWAIIGFFVYNIIFLLSIASNSMSQLMGLSEGNYPFVPAMPVLVANYWGMLFYLLYFVPKVKRPSEVAT